MNAQLRRAAQACLFSTVTGMFLGQGDLALAQSRGRVMHADAEEAVGAEPSQSPLPSAGRANPLSSRGGKSHAAAKPSFFSARNKTQSKPTARTAAVDENDDETAIEQTGGFSRRAPGMQAAAGPAQPQHLPPAPSTKTAVERELEELYRKNGREMPEMNMQEMPIQEIPGAAAPSQPGQYGQVPTAPSGNQPAYKPAKPSFFERIFGKKTRTKTPQRIATPGRTTAPFATQGSTSRPYTPATNAMVPPPEPAPYRPAQSMAAPGNRAQPLPLTQTHEPTLLAPDNGPAPLTQPPTLQAPPTTRSGRQPFLMEEAQTQGDFGSPNMARGAEAPATQAKPQITATQKPAAKSAVESPYSGLTIIPNESEGSIASVAELGKPVETKPASAKAAASATPKEARATPKAPAAVNSVLQHPLGSSVKPAPVPLPAPTPAAAAKPAEKVAEKPAAKPQSKPAVKIDNDEESLELEDEDIRPQPPRSAPPSNLPAGVAPSQPIEEQPVFPNNQSAATQDAARPVSAAVQKGLKGFCPVILKDERRLVEARPQFKSEHRGQTYLFSSIETKRAFDKQPQRYAPAGGGKDIVRLAGGDAESEGSLEHAAWYRGRLYLFSSPESRREFVDAPSRFSVNE